jgi:hypothetical protein
MSTQAHPGHCRSGEPWDYRLTADAYDGLEFTEMMAADGVVYTPEFGYLVVEKHQNVFILPHTATHGHGGNRFEEYVWGKTVQGEVGWLPVNFRMEFVGMGFVCLPDEILASIPEETLLRPVPEETAAIAATGLLPDITAAIAATGLFPAETAETAAIAATGLPSFGESVDFDC